MLAPLHNVIGREGHEMYLFLPLWKYGRFTRDSVHPYNGERTITLHFQHFLKQRDSMINPPAFTAVTKYSMKRCANRHLHSSGERSE